MKTKCLFLVIVLFISLGFSQTYYSDFEDGTLQNWTNVDESTYSMSVQGPIDAMYLEKICDGTNSPVGEMAIINRHDFNGDLSCSDPIGINCWGGFELYMRNSNTFDLKLRFGFKNSNGSSVASDPGLVIPANSDWDIVPFFGDSELFVVDGTESVQEVLADVQEIIFFHNENLAYGGEAVVGSLEIDFISTVFLLSANDASLQQTTVYPNPFSDLLHIELPIGNEMSFTLFNLLGQVIEQRELYSDALTIETSNLDHGVYFITVKTETSTFTKRVIKN